MNVKPILCTLFAAIGTAALGAAPMAADDGLVARRSPRFDEVRVAPAAEPYRKFVMAPVEVELLPEYRQDANALQRPTQRHSPEEKQRMARDMATSLEKALAMAFREAGYEPVSQPGPGVLLVKARLSDLHVNAPENTSMAGERNYVREAGEATLNLHAVDSATGVPVVAIHDHRKARFGMAGASLATNVSNQFWFEEMFQRWSEDAAREVGAAGKRG